MSNIFLEIANTQQELSSFPISNKIKIRTDKKIYPLALVNGVSVFNGNDFDSPLPDDTWARVFSPGARIKTPEVSFSTFPEQGNPGFWITEMAFSPALLVNSKYFIGFSKDLYTNCFVITEAVKTGLGNLTPFLSSRPLGGYGTYTIQVLSDSYMHSGSNVVSFRIVDSFGLSRDTTMDLSDSSSILLYPGISCLLDEGLPYSSGDTWEIVVSEPAYLNAQLIQNVQTLDSSMSISQSTVDSKRATESDIVTFYNNGIWNPSPTAPNIYGGQSTPQYQQIAPMSVGAMIEYVSTDVATITFDESMDFSTMSTTTQLGNAFGLSILGMLVPEIPNSKYKIIITRVDDKTLEVALLPGDLLALTNPEIIIDVS